MIEILEILEENKFNIQSRVKLTLGYFSSSPMFRCEAPSFKDEHSKLANSETLGSVVRAVLLHFRSNKLETKFM